MGKVAFLMAGQGAQFPGMGKALYENWPDAKNIFDMAEGIRPGTLNSLIDPDFPDLKDTSNTQIAVFLMDYVCDEMLKHAGIEPDLYAGFSLGEIAALAAAESLSLPDAIRLVTARGRYMQECGEKYPGGMVAIIRPDEKKVAELCEKDHVYIANISSAQQISVSGSVENMAAFQKDAKEAGIRFVEVQVSGAFHTPYMKEAAEKLGAVLNGINFKAPKTPVYSDVTASFYPEDPSKIREMLQKQIVNPVRFRDILKDMQEKGADTFVECGPGHTLTGFVRKTLKNVRYLNVADPETFSKAKADLIQRPAAVVTGAARGIGKAVALSLAEDGYNVALLAAHDSDALNETAKEVADKGVRAAKYVCDVSDPKAVDETAAKILEEFGTVKVLVNDAGITRDGLFMGMPKEDMERVLQVNLLGTMYVTQAFLKPMVRQRSGKIINLSSIVGIEGNAGQANYAASKAGVIGFTKTLAKEYGRKNITVNAVAPGFIETDMTAAMTEDAKKAVKSRISLRRLGQASEVAELIRFLASPKADYITGQVIGIDGGLN